MASDSQGLQRFIQIGLALVIVALGYWLFRSLTDPYKAIELEKEMTTLTRHRMGQVRTAMIRYEEVNGRYVTSLDSLIMFVKSDSLFSNAGDSIFGPGYHPDSLAISPRTGARFGLSINDTSRVKTYLLKDPNSDDRIGTLVPDLTRLNAASWE